MIAEIIVTNIIVNDKAKLLWILSRNFIINETQIPPENFNSVISVIKPYLFNIMHSFNRFLKFS